MRTAITARAGAFILRRAGDMVESNSQISHHGGDRRGDRANEIRAAVAFERLEQTLETSTTIRVVSRIPLILTAKRCHIPVPRAFVSPSQGDLQFTNFWDCICMFYDV